MPDASGVRARDSREPSVVSERLQHEIAERERAQERLAAFSSLAGRLNSVSTLEQAARLIAEVAGELIGWDACMLSVCVSGESTVRRILAIDTIDGRRQEVSSALDGAQPGPITQGVLHEGARLILRGPPSEEWPHLVPFGDTSRRSASLMFVPIRHGAKAVGLLTIQSYTPQAYTADDLETLQALADHCGGAMERIRTEERLRAFLTLAHRLNATTSMEEAARLIVGIADELFGWDACFLVECMPEDDSIRRILNIDEIDRRRVDVPFEYSGPRPHTMVRRVMAEGAKLVLRDEGTGNGEPGAGNQEIPDPSELARFGDKQRRSASLMFVPIRNGTRVLGVLSIQSYTPQAYTREDLGTLQALADHCGGAMERIRTEEAARRTQQNYQALVDSIDGVVWEADARTSRLTFVSRRAEQLLGYPLARWYAEPTFWQDHMHSDDREGAIALYRRAMQERRDYHCEYRMLAADGRTVWLRDAVTVVMDSGAPVKLRGVMVDITDRKLAEDALRDSEKRYRFLFEHNPQPMWVFDLETLKFLAVNDAAVRRYGYAREEFLAMNLLDIRAAEDRPRLVARIAEARRAADRLQEGGVWRHLRKDGTSIDVEITSHSLTFAGRPAGLVLANDVTERLRAEEALRASEAKWRSLVEHAPDFIVSLDRKCRIQLINRVVPPYTMEQVIGTSVYDYVAPEYHGLMREKFAHVFETGEPAGYEVPAMGREGQLAWYKCQVGPVWRDGCVAGLTVLASDITDRKRADESLRESEELNRRIIDTMMGGIVQVAADGSFVRANAHAQRILGLSCDELMRRYVSDFALETIWEDGTPCPVEEYPVTKCLRSGEPQPGTTIGVRRRDGSIAWAIYSAVPLRDPVTEQVSGAVVSFLDITERKHLEEHLHRARKLEAIGILAAGVAHDFNNMLMVIIGNSELALKGLRDAKRRQLLAEVVKAAERAHALTRQLLALGRQQPSAPEPIELTTMFSGLQGMLASILGPEIRVNIETAEGVGRVRADRGQLERAVVNLAVNARDAMPGGGALAIRIANAPNGAIPKGAPPGRYVRLSVADTGRGLAPEVEKHLFEPFFTTKPVGKGTGLGLAIVHSFVQQCGGHIAYENRPGKGTTFHIYLPVVAAH